MNNYYMKADITNTRVFVRGIKGQNLAMFSFS